MLKKIANKVFKPFGYELIKKNSKLNFPIEINEDEMQFISEILYPKRNSSNSIPLSMVSIERLWAVISATKYIVENNIEGDLVECGVWRGGCSIAIARTLEKLESEKKVYLFDTFEGMTKPTNFDRDAIDSNSAKIKFKESQKENYNEWCYASLQDVKNSFLKYDLISNAQFIKGDVKETLKDEKNIPKKISLLRLDTDWYESTKIELEILYPLLKSKGVLMVDDYGHWEGARMAVDEYMNSLESNKRPFQWVLDYTGRGYIKII